MNTKKKTDVFGDAHLQLGVPLEWINGSEKQGNGEESTEPIKKASKCNSTILENKGNEVASQSTGGLVLVCDNVEEMLQVEVANVLITQCLGTFEVLQNINVKSLLRSFDAFDLPYAVDPKFVKVLGSVCLDLSPTSDVAGAHQRQLKKNLAAFDLEIDEVVGDGDCFHKHHKATPQGGSNHD